MAKERRPLHHPGSPDSLSGGDTPTARQFETLSRLGIDPATLASEVRASRRALRVCIAQAGEHYRRQTAESMLKKITRSRGRTNTVAPASSTEVNALIDVIVHGEGRIMAKISPSSSTHSPSASPDELMSLYPPSTKIIHQRGQRRVLCRIERYEPPHVHVTVDPEGSPVEREWSIETLRYVTRVGGGQK